MNEKKNYKWFILISLIILLTDSLFIYINYVSSRNVLMKDLRAQTSYVHNSFDMTIDIIGSNMQQIATYVSRQERVAELFYKGVQAVEREGGGAGGAEADMYRQQLFDYVNDSWSSMKKQFHARQLHFHMGPGSTSFLRVHKPSKFGDNMDNVRHTIADANHNNILTKGFETGRVYSGIRGVTPVFYTVPSTGERVHVGALEAGTSLKVMTDILKMTTDTDLTIFLTREHMDRNMWPEFVEQRNQKNPPIGDYAVEYATNDDVARFLRSYPDSAKVLRDGSVEIINNDGIYYAYSAFSFRDYRAIRDGADEPAGLVLVKKNVNSTMVSFEKNIFYNIIFALFGFIFVEILLFYGWRFGTRKLVNIIDDKTSELARMNSGLEEMVAQRTAELEEYNKNLQVMIDKATKENVKQEQLIFQQKKFADMGKMISAIAHQWRQPLSALGMYAQDIAEAYEMGELDDAYVANFEKTQVELVRHLSNTIDDFSDFFKPDKQETEFEVVTELLNLMKLISDQFTKRNITLNVSCECAEHSFSSTDLHDVPECEFAVSKAKGYLGEFKQAMLNVLYNAADAVQERMSRGEIERGQIDLVILGGDQEVVIRISDNGIGIPEEIINDIFNPYFTTKSEGKGTGIGLYMTKLILQDHMNGSIAVENNAGGGVSFIIKMKYLKQ